MAEPLNLDAFSMDELVDLIATASKLLETKKDARRKELLAELEKLDGIAKPAGVTRQRAAPQPMYRAPNGAEWSGRGGIPRAFKELGVATKDDMKKYLIQG